MSKTITIIVRLLPSNEEVDLSVPLDATAINLKETLLSNGLAPRMDQQGNILTYQLVPKSRNVVIEDFETLEQAGVQAGDTLLMSPVYLAGGRPAAGVLAYELPTRLAVGEKHRCWVRIAHDSMRHYLQGQQWARDANFEKIEISKVMQVQLLENAVEESLRIRNHNLIEQIISRNRVTEWNFDITPQKTGHTSLLLCVTMVMMLKGYGERKKDVFTYDQQVYVGYNRRQSADASQELYDLQEVARWSKEVKKEAVEAVANNNTGHALATLANFFQYTDLALHKSIILLQSQWNAGRNQYQQSLIDPTQWWMMQSKIHYSILETLQALDNGQPLGEEACGNCTLAFTGMQYRLGQLLK